jgi:ABC-type transport system involved in cytochrome c biogenesis ATPase subunit
MRRQAAVNTDQQHLAAGPQRLIAVALLILSKIACWLHSPDMTNLVFYLRWEIIG